MYSINVKNMVCDRCKKVLKTELELQGFQLRTIELGEIHFMEDVKDQLTVIRETLVQNGFEIIEEENEVVIAEIKSQMISVLENDLPHQNLSEYLSIKLNKDYSVLSKLFSTHEGITIEKYFIRLKIEKVKELIQMNDRTFSEIAYQLGYGSSSHLARQFKSITGMSMSEYQKTRDWNRMPFDQIV